MHYYWDAYFKMAWKSSSTKTFAKKREQTKSTEKNLTCTHQDTNNIQEVIIPLGGLQYWDVWYRVSKRKDNQSDSKKLLRRN